MSVTCTILSHAYAVTDTHPLLSHEYKAHSSLSHANPLASFLNLMHTCTSYLIPTLIHNSSPVCLSCTRTLPISPRLLYTTPFPSVSHAHVRSLSHVTLTFPSLHFPKTFLTLSLDDIARRADIASGAEAEHLLVHMVRDLSRFPCVWAHGLETDSNRFLEKKHFFAVSPLRHAGLVGGIPI